MSDEKPDKPSKWKVLENAIYLAVYFCILAALIYLNLWAHRRV